MKTIKSVETLLERAKRNKSAVLKRNGYPVYEIFYSPNNFGDADLYHYNTLTARVNLTNQTIEHIYGESVSDADSVGTFLHALGFSHLEFGYKPVNGGFYIWNHTSDERKFLSELTDKEELKEFCNNN